MVIHRCRAVESEDEGEGSEGEEESPILSQDHLRIEESGAQPFLASAASE
jgi:hypothetical protein